MILLGILLLAMATLGHLTFAVSAVNWLHAIRTPRWKIFYGRVMIVAGFFLVPSGVVLSGALTVTSAQSLDWAQLAGLFYLVLAAGRGCLAVGRFAYRLAVVVPTHELLENDTEYHRWRHDSPSLAATRSWRSLAKLPGNQLLDLTVTRKQLAIPNLPPQFDGLKIAHWSDLHFTGNISEQFFARCVEISNEFAPDLVAVTGDIVDKEACLPWIERTLGGIESREGVFYVLGNHDLRVSEKNLREALAAIEWTELGGRWQYVDTSRGRLLLAGNELPWFPPAATLIDVPSDPEIGRIGLIHSPDEFPWGTRGEMDLLLGGHTHGGQIRVPLVGAIVCPCLTGPRYAAGTFRERDTVLHVTRGLSGTWPLRFNCPNELALLTLRCS